MARQHKQAPPVCPGCGGLLKRIIGAQSRKKYWECVDKGPNCYRRECAKTSS